MTKIQWVSKFFKWALQITFFVLPVVLAIFWVNAPTPISPLSGQYELTISYMPNLPMGVTFLHPLPVDTKILGFVISLIPLCVSLCVLYFLIRLFKLFEQFEFFSDNTVRYIKYIGYTLFIGQLLSPIYQALLSAAITWHNAPGERVTSLSFSQANIGILLTALVIILISWIVAEGHKMNEERKYII